MTKINKNNSVCTSNSQYLTQIYFQEYILKNLSNYIKNKEVKYTLINNLDFIEICKRHQIINLFKENHECSINNFNKLSKAKYIFYQNQLKIISELFKKNNIHFFLFKGIALSDVIYNETHHRYFKDIDIFINSTQLKNAIEILLKNDFCFKNKISINNQINLINKNHFNEGILLIKNSILIDLHPIPDFIKDNNLKQIYSSFKDETITYKTPADSLNLVLLSAHARKHLWAKIIWLIDISLIIIKLNNEEYVHSVKLATQNKSLRALRLSILLSKNLFGLENPKLDDFKVGFVENKILKYLLKNIFNQNNSIKRKFKNIIINILLEDNFINSSNYLKKRITSKVYKSYLLLSK